MELRTVPTLLFRTALVVSVAAAGAQAFTGNVPADFTDPDVVVVSDPMDVGMPVQAMGATSGWEIQNAAFELDAMMDELRVGLDFVGIAGDADGDGFEGGNSAWLLGNGGWDFANLGGTESICIAFDFDGNFAWDVIAGVSSSTDASGFDVAAFNGMPLLPFGFGASMPAHMGAYMVGPDFELTISNLSGLVNYSPVNSEVCFFYAVFSGSYADDGVGEDYMAGELCVRDETRTGATEDVVSGFGLEANYPNPFNPTTSIRFNMGETANAELAVFNMAGQKVATLVNGLVGAGSHEVTFDASNLSSGVYFYTLNSGSIVETRKMILTK
ncbi:MAG: T9SS type A sorting domain-containing protein [Candidatus Delongbacteria bacterium]|jgi:hypothetical protein|nr:T9SS type A sorting domain-containing protein [Candidatus Cloacimonadota bacterium]MCA9786751.1 T9SS type A sorting domain-containing protein [Candidatus Cloacimonadota bacterium]MCB9473020.1 T9SS type A sorting domain-containing protein [Candidatus Delongbacteria bacterium]